MPCASLEIKRETRDDLSKDEHLAARELRANAERAQSRQALSVAARTPDPEDAAHMGGSPFVSSSVIRPAVEFRIPCDVVYADSWRGYRRNTGRHTERQYHTSPLLLTLS